MRISTIVFAAVLAGCGTWTKPGGTAAQLETDRQACAAEAYRVHPPRMLDELAPPISTDRKCSGIYGEAHCAPLSQRQQGVQTDLNSGARSAAADQCLRSRGYTFSSK
jgi:hypothetical protein